MLISNWRLKAHDLTVEDRRTAADGDLERENRGGGGRGEREGMNPENRKVEYY